MARDRYRYAAHKDGVAMYIRGDNYAGPWFTRAEAKAFSKALGLQAIFVAS